MSQWNVSWHHQTLQIPELWDQKIVGQGVTVALLDTGLAAPRGLDRSDFEYLDSAGNSIGASDMRGHGTCCGSIIASYLGGCLGIAPYVKLVSFRVLETGATIDDVESALTHIAECRPDIDIVSCSFVLSGLTARISSALQALTSAGQLVVAAAGNSNSNPSPFPELTPNAIAVAAVDQSYQPLSGARMGDWIDVAAPGKDIPVVLPWAGQYGTFNESSAAAAVTSGVIALILSTIAERGARRNFARHLEKQLRDTAKALPGTDSDAVGCGVIQPKVILDSMKSLI